MFKIYRLIYIQKLAATLQSEKPSKCTHVNVDVQLCISLELLPDVTPPCLLELRAECGSIPQALRNSTNDPGSWAWRLVGPRDFRVSLSLECRAFCDSLFLRLWI